MSITSNVADLTPAEAAAIRAQVGPAMDARGFNPADHITANTVNGVLIAPTYVEPTVGNSSGANSSVATPVTTSGASSVVSGTQISDLTQAQRDDLYRQVGDAMYASGFNYDAHIAGNTVNGVFIPPVYIPADTSNLLTLPAIGTAAYDALLKETGGASARAGFNYAAHVAAIVSTARSDLSYDDVIRLIQETGKTDLTDFDVVAYRQATGSTIGLSNAYSNAIAAKVASDDLEKIVVLAMPAVGTPAYDALLAETGGASANPGFNYAAHVAAITSQKVLTSLSYSEVMTLIVETGKSDFTNFDLAAYSAEKNNSDVVLSRFIKEVPVTTTLPAKGSLEYQELLTETGLSNLDNFDYAAHLAAKQEVKLAEERLLGTSGDDVLTQTNSSKSIYVAGAGNDQISSGASNDFLIGGAGNDKINGGAGTDVAVFDVKKSSVVITKDASGNVLVQDSTGVDGTDTLTGVERLSFSDVSIALDVNGDAGQAYRIYKAAFDRDPMQGDQQGVGYWITQMDQGMDVVEVSARFIDSNEFRSLYGANPTDATFLNKVYENVLGRAPDASGFDWWMKQMAENPEKTRQKILADFSESPENVTNVSDLVSNGITYIPYAVDVTLVGNS